MGWLLARADAHALRVRGPDVQRLRELLPRDGRLLDLGGGTGVLAEALQGRDALVLEPALRKLRHGRRTRPGIAFVRGSAERVPLRDGSVGAVLASMSLHHVPDAGRALAEARRVLAPGGVLVVLEADPASSHGSRLAWLEGWLGTGARFLPPGELLARLRAAGFRDAAHEPAHRGYLAHARR
jgi:demethylmenaquinone methyltransferase/2-methoxy-6-polyprenyl-1,4-benzoquinol methylase